jgi:hypothetical protein
MYGNSETSHRISNLGTFSASVHTFSFSVTLANYAKKKSSTNE